MKVHFISIGGSVMHQLAIALKKKGYEVTGSDDEIFEPSRSNLAAAGILPAHMGWFPQNITGSEAAVILGMHARIDNPELARARQLNLPVYSFPEYIYQESLHKKRVVVGGSHGKTTTTAMIMHVLQHAGQQFDYLVGARLKGFEQSVQVTDAPVIVCEGDEYPASAIERKPKFHFLFPHIAILTGIAWDHINVFPTFDNYLEQFIIFLHKIEEGGLLIYNQTDAVLGQLVKEHAPAHLRCQPYGIPGHSIDNGRTTINIENQQGEVKVFGHHNLLNMHAAWHACSQLGIPAQQFVTAMGSFEGAARRLELVAAAPWGNVYRDFAHAPSKVKATMQAVKQQFTGKKLVAVLELHTYSSLNQQFMSEYKGTLNDADEAAVFYAGHALEIKKMPPLPRQAVLDGFARPGLQVFTQKAELEHWLRHANLHNANLLLMSSGNFDGLDVQQLAADLATPVSA